MRKLSVVIALSLLTCGTPGSNPDDPNDPNNPNNPPNPLAGIDAALKNGTRLRIKYWNAEDGTVALGSGFYDTQLGIDCNFNTAEDGMTRCLPLLGPNASTELYLDASCAQPFTISDKCRPAQKYGYMNSSMSCAQYRIFGLTEITSPPAMIYSNGSGTCRAMANPYANNYRMYAMGATVPASQFVAATMSY